jgi:subtilisin family serine protease
MVMSRNLHILARAGLLAALCCFASFAEDRYVVHTNGDIRSIAARHGLRVVQSFAGSGNGHHVLASAGQNPLSVIRGLALDASVVSVEADQPIFLPGQHSGASVHPAIAAQGQVFPLDGTLTWYFSSLAPKGYTTQPASATIQIDAAHGIVTGGSKVAVIDTGIDRTNLVLASSIGEGWDFVNNLPLGMERADLNQETTPILDQETTPILDQETTPILDGGSAIILSQETTPILDQETTPILDSKKFPAYGHGTMVAGLIHLVAPTATLLPVRAFAADGTSTISQIVAGIYWAVDHGADVINMSFSTQADSLILQAAINAATAKGVICVAAAGNDGAQIAVWPAAYSNVIGVGSTNNLFTRSLFSNYGSVVSLAAPGEALITTYPSSNFGLKQHFAEVWGTSFSTPLVAGTAALLAGINSRINESQASQLFSQSSAPIGNQGLGFGELNVYQAVVDASKKKN